MQRVPIADFAATVPWSGISGKPAWLDGDQPTGITTVNNIGLEISGLTAPAVATKKRPPGNPSGPFETIWARYVCNVKDFGALGSGVSDDTTALNSAIAAVNSAGGGTIYVPTGIYNAIYLNLIQVPCLIYGDGIGASVLRCRGNDGLAFYGPHVAGIYGLSVEDSYTSIESEGGLLIVNNCQLKPAYRGVSMIGVRGGQINGVRMISAGTSAIGVYGSANDFEISNTRMLVGTSWAHAIYLTVGTAVLIDGIYANGVAGNLIYAGTGVLNSRITNVAGQNVLGASMVLDDGVNNFVDGIFGLGGNTDDRWEARKELFRRITFVPGAIPVGYGFYHDATLEGAAIGDQAMAGCQTLLDPWVLQDVKIKTTDECRISVINVGTSAIYIGTSVWNVRVFN